MAPSELRTIDELATKAGLTRSQYLVGSALAKRGGELLYQVAQLQDSLNALTRSVEERAPPIALRDLEDAVSRLVPILSRRDVPADVKDLVRSVLTAGRALW